MTTEEVRRSLPWLRDEFTATEGKPFRHFFCPILLEDEDVELCMGHVVSATLANCCRARVVQRADVDNFYGTVVEADFGTLVEVREKSPLDILFDQKLRTRVRPRIVVDGEHFPHYFTGRGKPDHSHLIVERAQGETVHMMLAKTEEEIIATQGKTWNLVFERDCRISALVSLVKVAFLTLFRIHGYRWALSSAGLSIGHDVLGKFFRENRGKDLCDIKRAAKEFFLPYKHMVRPILADGCDPHLLGTVEDGRAGVCFGSSGRPFAQVVFVRIGAHRHAVLMPAFCHPDSVEAYWEFLKNDRERIRVSSAWYDEENGRWCVHPKPIEVYWPKEDATFEFK